MVKPTGPRKPIPVIIMSKPNFVVTDQSKPYCL